MDLLEHEGKDLFAAHGVPVPDRELYTGGDVELPTSERLVVKAQVPATKRKAHGGIRIVDRDEAVDAADKMLGTDIEGHTIGAVLIESMLDIKQELYLSLSLNRAEKRFTCIYSEAGGSGIEDLAEEQPDKVHQFSFFTRRSLVQKLGDVATVDGVAELAGNLYGTLRGEDALLVEVNPLAVTADGPVAADAKVRLDENAFHRHDREFDRDEATGLAGEAEAAGLEFVDLDGDIAIIGNGAGLVMATLDSIDHFGGAPANFLDIGGGADMEKMRDAMRITLKQADVGGLFVNIFGGITRCDEVAQGIISFVEEESVELPMVVRLVGTNQEKGKQLLEDAGIHALDSMDACAEKIVDIVGGDGAD